MVSLDDFLAQLADSSQPPAASKLSRLSDLSLSEAKRFEELWPGLEVVRRRQVISQMVAVAESTVEMNFDRVFKACLKDRDETVRLKAIEGLWECHEPAIMGTLIALLSKDPSPSVRAAAAKALGVFALLAELGKLRHHYGVQLEEALLSLLENGSQPLEVRQRALESIAYFSRPRTLEVIEQAYNSNEPQIKISAIRAMGRNLAPQWLEILLPELSSPKAELRLEATTACGELGEEKAIPYLIERLEDKDSRVQLAAIQALGKIGGKRAIKALQQMLRHPRAAVQKAAQEALEEAQLIVDPISMVAKIAKLP